MSVFSIGIIFHIKSFSATPCSRNPACSAVRFLMRCLLAEHLHAMSAVIAPYKRNVLKCIEPFIANSEDLHAMQLSNTGISASGTQSFSSFVPDFPFRQHHAHFTCRFRAEYFQLFDAKMGEWHHIVLGAEYSHPFLRPYRSSVRLSPIPPRSGLLREYDSSASL